jgi:hypothetical protein
MYSMLLGHCFQRGGAGCCLHLVFKEALQMNSISYIDTEQYGIEVFRRYAIDREDAAITMSR